MRVVSPITTEETLLKNLPVRQRDSRLPAPGSIITKNYRGNTIEVKVLETGDGYRQTAYQRVCVLRVIQMTPRILPPVKNRFVRNRSERCEGVELIMRFIGDMPTNDEQQSTDEEIKENYWAF